MKLPRQKLTSDEEAQRLLYLADLLDISTFSASTRDLADTLISKNYSSEAAILIKSCHSKLMDIHALMYQLAEIADS